MQKQLSLFQGDSQDFNQLAGLIPTIRSAMNRAAGEDEAGRKLLVDKINFIATSAGVHLTSGNVKAISKDTLDKWLAPSDRDHTPSLLATVVFCAATGDHAPLQMMLNALGLDVMTNEDRMFRDYGKACKTVREASKRKKMLEDSI